VTTRPVDFLHAIASDRDTKRDDRVAYNTPVGGKGFPV
jgi:hypothetical protein